MKKRPVKKQFVLDEAERQLFLDAFERLPLHGRVLAETEVVLPAPREKKHKSIEASLDLHGLSKENASVRLKIFLDRCIFLGHRRVLVIHGKGSGILRESVRRMLGESSNVAMVSEASARLGGDGAVIVDLRKRESCG